MHSGAKTRNGPKSALLCCYFLCQWRTQPNKTSNLVPSLPTESPPPHLVTMMSMPTHKPHELECSDNKYTKVNKSNKCLRHLHFRDFPQQWKAFGSFLHRWHGDKYLYTCAAPAKIPWEGKYFPLWERMRWGRRYGHAQPTWHTHNKWLGWLAVQNNWCLKAIQVPRRMRRFIWSWKEL